MERWLISIAKLAAKIPRFQKLKSNFREGSPYIWKISMRIELKLSLLSLDFETIVIPLDFGHNFFFFFIFFNENDYQRDKKVTKDVHNKYYFFTCSFLFLFLVCIYILSQIAFNNIYS